MANENGLRGKEISGEMRLMKGEQEWEYFRFKFKSARFKKQAQWVESIRRLSYLNYTFHIQLKLDDHVLNQEY